MSGTERTKTNKKERGTFWGDKGTKGDNINISNISNSRWVMIKKCVKLKNNSADPKRGMENYNPAGSMITSTRSWFTT